jgi:hypothetical protein
MSEKGPCIGKGAVAPSQALNHFERTVSLWKEGDVVRGIVGLEAEARISETTNAVAGAGFYLAETKYEDALRADPAQFQRKVSWEVEITTTTTSFRARSGAPQACESLRLDAVAESTIYRCLVP